MRIVSMDFQLIDTEPFESSCPNMINVSEIVELGNDAELIIKACNETMWTKRNNIEFGVGIMQQQNIMKNITFCYVLKP